ncbi:hypothetical protein Tco_1370961 [Tanacetum coccineum]
MCGCPRQLTTQTSVELTRERGEVIVRDSRRFNKSINGVFRTKEYDNGGKEMESEQPELSKVEDDIGMARLWDPNEEAKPLSLKAFALSFQYVCLYSHLSSCDY